MLESNWQEVVAKVASYLRDCHPEGIDLEIQADGVHQDLDKWWYVPVKPSSNPGRTYVFYEALADVEEELEQKENLDVVLVPTYNND
jgi:hypothetical protein